jgi:hypothetical protein
VITYHVFRPEFEVAYDDEAGTFSCTFDWSASHETSLDEHGEPYDDEGLTQCICEHVDDWVNAGILPPNGEWKPYSREMIAEALRFLMTLTHTDNTTESIKES